jgi:micrococcal nuclease
VKRQGWWRGWILLALAAAALLVRCEGGSEPGGGGTEGESLRARVVEVVDGDTIRVELDRGGVESVRYIGIDTPESNPDQPLECFGHEAEDANASLVAGRELDLELGAEPRDDYGRLLAYVRVGSPRGILVNAELVRRGFARTLTIAPNDRLAPLLRGLETAAARAGRGLWGACGR